MASTLVSNSYVSTNPDIPVKTTLDGNTVVQHVIVDSGGGSSSSTTATRTQVADTASDALILAANTSRIGASIQNDSSAVLYLALGTAAATATDYSVRLVQYSYFEVPFGYTGEIRGIWATDPGDGAARVTEYT